MSATVGRMELSIAPMIGKANAVQRATASADNRIMRQNRTPLYFVIMRLLVRLYRPRAEILTGKWKFPEPRPVT
jgi:hypothetical protein